MAFGVQEEQAGRQVKHDAYSPGGGTALVGRVWRECELAAFLVPKLHGLAMQWSGTLLLDILATLAWLWWGRRRSLLPCA